MSRKWGRYWPVTPEVMGCAGANQHLLLGPVPGRHQVLDWFGMRTCIPSAKSTKKAWINAIFNGKIDYKWVMINNSNNYVSVYRGYVEWLMDLSEHIVDVGMTTQLGSTLQLRCCKGMLCPAGQQAWYAKSMRKWPYKNCHLWLIYPSDWWFQTFFIFPYIGNNHPYWLIFFRGVETTNQHLWLISPWTMMIFQWFSIVISLYHTQMRTMVPEGLPT